MPEILALLVFQSSRQQLLSILMAKIDSARAHRDEHKAHNEPEDEAEGRYIDNMLKAFQAADDHSKRLEYWSDLREMSRKSEISGGAEQDWGHGCQSAGTNGRESSALDDGVKQAGKDKGKRKIRVADELDVAPNENVPEGLTEEDKDDRQIEAAKKEAELRQLAEVGELKDEGKEDGVKSPAKLTSFSDDEHDDDSEHEGHHHDD
jgi:hypothetical protein